MRPNRDGGFVKHEVVTTPSLTDVIDAHRGCIFITSSWNSTNLSVDLIIYGVTLSPNTSLGRQYILPWDIIVWYDQSDLWMCSCK